MFIQNLCVEENSCEIIVFLVFATKKLQNAHKYNRINLQK